MRAARPLAVAALVALALTGCAKTDVSGATVAKPKASTSTPAPTSDSNFPTPEPADLETTTPDAEPTSDFTLVKFGETGSFTVENDNEFEVTVNKPTKAKCQYSSIGCDRPDTGDRIVTTKVKVKNVGTSAIEISRSMFVLEFGDGTRMEPGDGSASDYTPDSDMEYGHKIRPGATYSSTLTFEAPKGAFSIIMLNSSFDAEDLYGWK